MGGSAPNPRVAFDRQIQQYLQYLPQIAQTTAGAQPGIDLSQAQGAAGATPIYSEAGLTNLQRYALPYAQAGNAVTRENSLAGAATNADVLRGPGADAARAGTAINREANPEFYSTRSAASDQTGNLLRSINLNGLSGGETAAVERSLNQSDTATGNLGLDNATNAVKNAMTFGSALQGKRDALGAALGTATNFLNASQGTSFNPVAVALSQPATSTQGNFGTSQFTGVAAPGQQAFQLGGNLMGAGTANNTTNQPLQAQSSYNNSAAGIMGSMPSYS